MANPNTPQGLVPIQSLSSAPWTSSLRVYFVPAAQTNALYVGDPVIKQHAAADTQGTNAVDLAAAGTSNQITGVVCAFIGTCTAGSANPGFFGLSGTPGNVYRPATTGLDYYVLVSDDPEAMYYIQSSDTGGVPTATNLVGLNANLIAGTGSAYTGWSGWQLNPTGAATTNTLQLRVIGVLPEIDNVIGSAHCKFIVQINQATELPHQAGI